MRFKIKPLFQLICSFISIKTFAAACCSGGFATPALIPGDDRAQITTSYSYSQIAADVGADTLWRKRDTSETSETLRIEAAHIFWDRWQAGVSIPIVRRTRAEHSSAGLGDIATTFGYEYLPDWDYNPWRPRGLGFIQLTLPTGRSIDEAGSTFQLDSRGRGFWALGIGTLLTKVLGRWDMFAIAEGHRSFSKEFSNSQSAGILRPGFGGSFGLGGGYNWPELRLGASLTWIYEDPVNVSGTLVSEGTPQRYANLALAASHLFKDEWAVTATYSDQTLFGNPVNTSLGRGITLFLQKRWLR